MTTAINNTKEVLSTTWKEMFKQYENIHSVEVTGKEFQTGFGYGFYLRAYTKKGKLVHFFFNVRKYQRDSHITVEVSDNLKTKELIVFRSELIDIVMENLDRLDNTLLMIQTFSTTSYPDGPYWSKERRQADTQKTRRKGMTKAEILEKKDEILAFYKEVKNKDLPDNPLDQRNYESRVFCMDGTGANQLLKVLVELGIAEEGRKFGKSYSPNFITEGYKSTYLAIMDAWEAFLQKTFKPIRIYIHTWYG
ncbi:hypothetical protein [Bacillus toyonensis]|uniref:hypothetical protein n=1 Tax=Bacillus toyonensis TaxID=155322 RepID=UPI002E1F37DF|nr:hypothetical protein [Bacillus toyonensis]